MEDTVELVVPPRVNVGPRGRKSAAQEILLRAAACHTLGVRGQRHLLDQTLADLEVRFQQHNPSVDSPTLRPGLKPCEIVVWRGTGEETPAVDAGAVIPACDAAVHGRGRVQVEEGVWALQDREVQVQHEHLLVANQAQDVKLREHAIEAVAFLVEEASIRIDEVHDFQLPDKTEDLQRGLGDVLRMEKHQILLGAAAPQGRPEDQGAERKASIRAPQRRRVGMLASCSILQLPLQVGTVVHTNHAELFSQVPAGVPQRILVSVVEELELLAALPRGQDDLAVVAFFSAQYNCLRECRSVRSAWAIAPRRRPAIPAIPAVAAAPPAPRRPAIPGIPTIAAAPPAPGAAGGPRRHP